MADKKQLILVVEGNAALGRHWDTIVTDYLLKIIRSFCGTNETTVTASPNVEMAMVQFTAHGSYSSCLVQRSAWTRNVDYFLEWLSCMQFTGGGFSDAAIAEGLAEALMMFPSPNGSQTQQNEAVQKHCILVSASNPYPLPTPVYQPPNKNETQFQSRLSDAETVAKSFPQRCVSLSVICPRQLLKLKAIYKAGKMISSAPDPTVNVDTNPHYLVLISENFMEACAALCPSGMTNPSPNQSPSNMEVTSASPVSEPPPTSISPVNESLLNQQSVPAGNISPVTVKVEPSTVSSLSSSHALQNVPPCTTSQGVSSLQTSSPFPTSQESPMKVSILNNLSQACLAGGTPTSIGGNPVAMHMSNMMSSSVPVVQSATSSRQSSIMSMAEPAPLVATTQAAQQTNVGHSQDTSSTQQSGRSRYAKAWEGELVGKRQGQSVFITRLEAYRASTTSQSLVEGWPSTFIIDRVISQDVMNNKQHAGKAEFLVFRAMNDHGLLGQLQERKLCAVIRLQSQILLLTVCGDKRNRMLGMILPGDMVEYKPRIPRGQPPPQQQQQQEQQKAGTGTNQGTGGRTKLVGEGQVSSPEPKA